MKFGKQILAQQISGWSAYYLDYKSLKKIINSLEKGRLGDAALFASGLRPEHLSNGVTPASVGGEPASYSGAGTNAQIIPRAGGSDELQAHKAAFFFKLERELEKINAFYLQKEAELKVRLRTLVDKKRVILARRGAAKLSKESPSFFALYEGFRYFDKDLSKLQQFIEVNATGFRKILKKWDKRSKSQTKELYLARQVEVQPCFNREFIAELSDIAAANVLELENLTESNYSRNGKVPDAVTGPDEMSSDELLDFAVTRDQEIDILSELEENLTSIIKSGQAEAAKEMARIARQSEDNTSISRVIWRALLEADGDAVKLVMNVGLPDYTFVDDINWRTCLHEASLAGNLQLVQACVENGVDVAKTDIYGRAAISYAAMNGHAQICSYLLTLPSVNAATVDLDGFSPLVLAVMNGKAEVVQILLSHGASVESLHPTDLVPLCLAAQGGHLDITRLLLARGAKIVPNSAGLTPQALAAGEGHAGCLQVLVDAGADANVREKGSLWTPIFYAAENGHLDCLEVLVNAGARLNALDEKGRDASFYAAWRGQIASLSFLLDAASRQKREATPMASEAILASNTDGVESPKPRKKSRADAEDVLPDLDLDGEIDGIPSLSLPPPIIPFRTYGHNYLDKRALITVSLTDSSVKLYKLQDPNRPEQFSTSSLKLIMTSRPDASASTIPHTIMLPLADEREVFSFQVESLERFSIEWELMPTFGSKVIGKAVALSSLFEGITDRKRFVLPLQDVYLKVVGEVSFEMDFVKPFDGVQLEIGGRVETYWKSTLPGSASAGLAGQQRMTPTGTASGGPSYPPSSQDGISTGTGFAASGSSIMSYSSPSLATASTASALDSGLFVTASSLSGQHLRIVVQVTKDGIAVAYPEFTLPVQGLDVYVGSVTGQQFKQFAHHAQRNILPDPSQVAAMGLVDWKLFLERCMMTLQDLLALLPISVGIDLDVLYPSSADVRGNPSLPKIEINHFVDAILHTVYRSGTTTSTETSRKILFSSRSPTVCTALNWKQPNYAVLFASYCGLARDNATGHVLFQPCDRDEPDARRLSVAEAVRFAKTNNLLGIMVDSILLQRVPQLIHSIKAAGLLLITIGRYTPPSSQASPPSVKVKKASQIANGTNVEVADGSVEDGIVIAR